MKKINPRSLLKKYLAGKASPEEAAIVEKWYAGADEKPFSQPDDVSDVKEQLYRRIASELGHFDNLKPLYNTRLFRILSAACLLLFAGVFAWHLVNQRDRPVSELTAKPYKTSRVADIEPPASVYAVLTLADGTKIRLDSAGNGALAVQTSAEIIKDTDGQITYRAARTAFVKGEYNTLSVPRGSRIISLRLSDGSLVVLNAESSITYPTVFSGNSRKVSITGEAYFEIAKNASMPFFVSHDSMSIEVTGTHFNVNSYKEEKNIAVTLLEGSVQVQRGSLSKSLVPGQQANINHRDGITINDNTDLDEVVAWKNGRFQFGEKADITSIMRQISRWYDVDIEYKGVVNQQFWGSMRRTANVSEVLEMLEETGRVKFLMENKKIIVMPAAKN